MPGIWLMANSLCEQQCPTSVHRIVQNNNTGSGVAHSVVKANITMSNSDHPKKPTPWRRWLIATHLINETRPTFRSKHRVSSYGGSGALLRCYADQHSNHWSDLEVEKGTWAWHVTLVSNFQSTKIFRHSGFTGIDTLCSRFSLGNRLKESSGRRQRPSLDSKLAGPCSCKNCSARRKTTKLDGNSPFLYTL